MQAYLIAVAVVVCASDSTQFVKSIGQLIHITKTAIPSECFEAKKKEKAARELVKVSGLDIGISGRSKQ